MCNNTKAYSSLSYKTINMKLKHLLLVAFLGFSSFLFAQTYTGQVLDSVSKQPIPYAAIQLENTSTGVISNEDGNFSLYLENVDENAQVSISCMGFSPFTISLKDLKAQNGIVYLSEYVNELDTVVISDEKITIDSIIARANRNLKTNYPVAAKQYKIFHRKTSHMDFKDLNFDIDKASGMRKSKLESANKSLDSLSREIKSARMVQFTDYMGTYYVQDSDNRKLKVNKATLLMDKRKDFSLEGVQKKGSEIILKYLDPKKSYKVKSGWFKVEDSLSLSEEFKDQKDEIENQTLDLEYLNNEAFNQLAKAQFKEGSFIRQVINPKYYDFELLDLTFFMNDLVYIVKFTPRKSSSKFSGTHYISSTDYGILRTDYQFAEGKRGQKFNLKLILGIKYIENLRNGKVIFSKNAEGTYELKYAYNDAGSYVYLHRPIKFVENSDDRDKVSFDILLEGNMNEKQEILVLDAQPLNKGEYDAYKQPKTVKYQQLKSYDPSIWGENNVLEPVAEMKQFKSLE